MPLSRSTMTSAQRLARPVRGFTLIGLLTWAIVAGFVGYVLVQAVPTVLEFYAIRNAVNRLAKEAAPTVPEIRRAFDRQISIDQSISSIAGKDLEITKENDRVVVRFAYEKEIELVSPVFLLIKYQGKSE